jgi:hypothetical protein
MKIKKQKQSTGINKLKESHWEMTTLDNFMLEWTAKYYTFINGKKT